MSPIKALIFDFDGLNLETEGPIYQSWLELYASYGVGLPLSTWSRVIGASSEASDPLENLRAQVDHPLDLQSIASKQRAREQELIAAQPIRPGVQAYLAGARRLGQKVGLASSSPCAWVTGYLAERGLINYFDCIRGWEDVRQAKPDPDLYLSLLAALGVQGDQAITCYCFDIQDEPMAKKRGRRVRLWDSCMYKEYTLHASGHNPRPTRVERLKNRMYHKFKFNVDSYGTFGCVGCGRCITLCPVNEDLIDNLVAVKGAA